MSYVVVVHLLGTPTSRDLVVGPFPDYARARRRAVTVERVAENGGVEGVQARAVRLRERAESPSSVLAVLLGETITRGRP